MEMSITPHPSPLSPHRYLITGGCGFIGTSLINHLKKVDPATPVRVLDNLSVGTRDDLAEVCDFTEAAYPLPAADSAPHAVQLVKGDIKDFDICRQCCEGIDVVVHLAANTGVAPSVEDPRADMEANVIGLFNMLEAARINKVDKFVFASSGAPVGEVEPPIHEEKAPRPVSPYGASKLAGEGYCSAYYRTFGVKTVSLRFGNVYGPRSKNKNSVVAKFIKQALAGETLEIYGDGSQTRDFIYIEDLIQAVSLAVSPQPVKGLKSSAACSMGPWGETFQIASSAETTVNEIALFLKKIMEEETGIKIEVTHGASRLGDVKRNYSDISKAKACLGYAPRTGLDAGLKLTIEYFKQRYCR